MGVSISKVEEGMYVEGWVTLTWIENMGNHIVYGPFKTEEEAKNWASQLIQEWTSVHPIYSPAYNRG